MYTTILFLPNAFPALEVVWCDRPAKAPTQHNEEARYAI